MVQKLHTLLAGFSSACKQKGTHRCKAPTLAIGYESICGSLATPSRTWRALALHPAVQIGRASCRERVESSVGAAASENKIDRSAAARTVRHIQPKCAEHLPSQRV